jgi:hypothetical protein
MGKRLLQTPNSQIKSSLRMLFLRSRERASVMKSSGYTCSLCGKKQSKKKDATVLCEVHHLEGVCNWQVMYDAIREQLLCSPDKMTVLCKECHKGEL